MNDFEGLLATDYGFKPQGKSAPMTASKPSANATRNSTNLNFGIQSHATTRSSSRNSNSFIDDRDSMFGSTSNRKTQDFGTLDGFADVFGGGGSTKYSSMPESRGGVDSGLNFDSMLRGSTDSGAKSSNLPVYDKPVYDDDIFDGVPGLKTSASTRYDDVFSSISSPPAPKGSGAFDDLLGSLGQRSKNSGGPEKGVADFDDLIPGFGGSSPSSDRPTSEANWQPKSTVNATKTTSNMMEDPFVVLESASPPVAPSSGPFTDPLEEIGKLSKSGSSRVDSSSVSGGVSENIDPFDGLGESVPAFSSKTNDRKKDRSPLKTGPGTSETHNSGYKEPIEKSSIRSPESDSRKKTPVDNYSESNQTTFDMPTFSNGFPNSIGQTGSPPSYVNASSNETDVHVNMSSPAEENLESEDVWLTVSEFPLFTQPTSAPPPSRPPPPRPAKVSKAEKVSLASTNGRKKVNDSSSFPTSTQYFQSSKPVPAASRSSVASQIDELEDFAVGRTRNNVELFSEELGTASDAAASAAAMKEAMDRAEAKFRHAKEVRERENAKAARSKETVQPEKDEKASQDAQERAFRERQERWQQREREEEEEEQKGLEQESERVREIEREMEEKEREQRRLEKERERAREIEREREKVRQAVERATKEARERAATEARLKAERAAVQRAQAEARGRAAADAKQRAEKVATEARERANAEAKERANAEARERATAEAREKEARERAAVARAEADARLRAERAAVQRAAAEARERAAAEARQRAAASAKVNLQKNEDDLDDLESFFSMGARPSSAPRPRANSSNPVSDTQFQNRQGPEAARRTSVGSSSGLRKASSTTNIVDDLSSIFGGVPSSGEFQEVEGESEERRRARLERHQRTEERAAKALAEKNQRDLQAQRDQAERHRIAETIDAEIKRWSAGKEGNLRALLSTMQYVLWPECGWQPVSLTDLITGASVKKFYRKATLCIHPDKVQQKGANLQQKYIAEKVFDLLKEAWNKFNSEELF